MPGKDDASAAPAWRAVESARERVIDEQLLAQAALQAELDRDAHVEDAIERARRQIQAQVYVERAALSVPRASAAEIDWLYAENPALFSQRRFYGALELIVVMPSEQVSALQATVGATNYRAEVVRWLETRRLPFDAASSSRAAEHVPIGILRRLFEMDEGQMAAFPTSRGATVVLLGRCADASSSELQARPAIARYLLNRKRLEAAHFEITKLRERAKLAYQRTDPARPATMVQSGGRAQAHTALWGMRRISADLAGLRYANSILREPDMTKNDATVRQAESPWTPLQ